MGTESNPSGDRVTLNGQYAPSNFFEVSVQFKRMGHTLAFSDGKIEVTMDRADPMPTAEEQAAIAQEVGRLIHAQMVSGKPYCEWSPLTLTRHKADGTQDIAVSAHTGISVSPGGGADAVLADRDGKIIRDTRGERLASEKDFLEKCLKHGEDAILNKLLASYATAIKDKSDMFVHLYEIRDAISKRFKGGHAAEKTLGIDHKAWSDFGVLANIDPLAESRHRGSHTDLRPATEAEREQATEFARRLIESYLNHIDKTP